MTLPVAPWGSAWSSAGVGAAMLGGAAPQMAPNGLRQRVGYALRGLSGSLDPATSPYTSPAESVLGGFANGFTGYDDSRNAAAAATMQAQNTAADRRLAVAKALSTMGEQSALTDYYRRKAAEPADGGTTYQLFQHPGMLPQRFNPSTGALEPIPGATRIPFAYEGAGDDTPPALAQYRGAVAELTRLYAGKMNEVTGKPWTADDIAQLAEQSGQLIDPGFRRPRAASGPSGVAPAERAAQLRAQGLGGDAIKAQMVKEGYIIKGVNDK